MRRSLLFSLSVFSCFLLTIQLCPAQSGQKYQAALHRVPEAGFYKIVLHPSIVARCMSTFNDIRVVDNKGNQVPYILQADYNSYSESNFVELPILSVGNDTLHQTHIILQNKPGKTISELLLVIRNTDADRNVTISGSDDSKRWFVIKENIQLDNFHIQGKDRFIQSLLFPASSYNYFKIIINGKGMLPVNIARAGIYQDSLFKGRYIPVPLPEIFQKDSQNKSSYVDLVFKDKYLVDKLELEIKGPRYFRRQVMLVDGASRGNYDFEIGSASSILDPVNIKSKKVSLVIRNDDNPPLKVISASAYQLNRYLLAWLEPSETYRLQFGDSTALAPRYDLEFFKDSIRNKFVELGTGPVTSTNIKVAPEQADKNTNLMLWLIIGAVLVFLLFLTLRMAKEVDKKKS